MIRTARRLAALLCIALLPAAASAATPAAHTIQVRIEPQTQLLEGRDSIRFETPYAAILLLASRFRLDTVVVDGHNIGITSTLVGQMQRLNLPAARRVDLHWSGTLATLDRGLDHRETLSYAEPASGIDGTFLPAASGWYPIVQGLPERYSLEIDLPAEQRGIAPGRLAEESVADGRYRARFEFPHPAEGIVLLAGPYRIEERRVRTALGSEVRLRTYFHETIAGLAPAYLDAVAGYLDLYERWIGAYPFSEFSIVSSPTPTGFGMPGLTYLGIDVLRLPFIRATSLGHEVLHNWWGNGVYPDYAQGNWSEGLTNFMADYAYRERESPDAAAAMRLAWLRDYAAVPNDEDTPLARFSSRTHGASQIIGYDKSAMLFFMLRDEIGKPAFDRGLRDFWDRQRFQVASWNDLRTAFERASGRNLAAFFEQWLQRAGAPALQIADAKTEIKHGGWRLSVTLAQGRPAYVLSVPLSVRTSAGVVTRRVPLALERSTVTLELPARPQSVELDPQMRLWRRLAAAEAPPILRDAMLALRPSLIAPTADPAVRSAAQALAARMLEGPQKESTGAAALLVAGLHADIDAWLAHQGMAPRPATLAQERGSAQVWTARTGDGRVAVLVSARDAQSLAALARPLPHYGRESWLIFEGARMTSRGTWPAQPQIWHFK